MRAWLGLVGTYDHDGDGRLWFLPLGEVINDFDGFIFPGVIRTYRSKNTFLWVYLHSHSIYPFKNTSPSLFLLATIHCGPPDDVIFFFVLFVIWD